MAANGLHEIVPAQNDRGEQIFAVIVKRTYRIVLRPSHLRRGVYTVRILVAAASGKRQVAQKSSRRR